MDVGAIKGLVGAAGLDDIAACQAELSSIAAVRSIVAAREATVMRRLRDLGSDAEGEHSECTKSSSKSSSKARKRGEAAETIPQLDTALADGATTPEHVDLVADALAGLSPQDRERLAGSGDEIRTMACQLSEPEFRRWLVGHVRRLRRDDAAARLDRQKKASRASWWLDNEGMWNLRGRFDPETGTRLQPLLAAERERLAHTIPASEGPQDPLERHEWLQARALANLLSGDTPVEQRVPEMIALIDAKTLLHGEHDDTFVDTGEFDLPIDTIRRWALLAAVTPVVVGVDGTRLLLGRTTRLANREQRRALRVLYPTCALCDTAFEHCRIHHVHWWDKGGHTDIANLLPLCWRHHVLAHQPGWQYHLAPDRTLTVIAPNGERRTHAPPRARAA